MFIESSTQECFGEIGGNMDPHRSQLDRAGTRKISLLPLMVYFSGGSDRIPTKAQAPPV